jgi:hypothetical protein
MKAEQIVKHLHISVFFLALLLAYLNGNGRLCRELLKKGSTLSTVNKNGISIFNAEVASKKLLFSLLGNACQINSIPKCNQSLNKITDEMDHRTLMVPYDGP